MELNRDFPLAPFSIDARLTGSADDWTVVIGLTDFLYQRHREITASLSVVEGQWFLCRHDGQRFRRAIAERTVRADVVVVMAPLFDQDLCFLEAVEDFLIRAFVTQFAIERFAVTVLPGVARLDVERGRAYGFQPFPYHFCGKLRPIV